jgi:hypothetical protein
MSRADSARYHKPVVIADRLELLRGPVTGTVRLPTHLKWSGSTHYDLAVPGRIVDLYRTVLNEAATPDDLHTWLDQTTLTTLWPRLWLPAAVRQAWEARFPELLARHDVNAA